MSTLEFRFKLVYTPNVWDMVLESNMTFDNFIDYINNEINLRLFNIHPQYYVEIVPAYNYINIYPELAPAIEHSNIKTIGENFKPKTASFYLRPVHPITKKFIRRNNYYISPNFTMPNTPDISRSNTPDNTRPNTPELFPETI